MKYRMLMTRAVSSVLQRCVGNLSTFLPMVALSLTLLGVSSAHSQSALPPTPRAGQSLDAPEGEGVLSMILSFQVFILGARLFLCSVPMDGVGLPFLGSSMICLFL